MAMPKVAYDKFAHQMTIEELCDTIKAKTIKPTITKNEGDIGIYNEYLKRGHRQMLFDIKELGFYDCALVGYLRSISEICNKIDRKTPKNSVLGKIETLFSTMDDESLKFGNHISYVPFNNNDKISGLLINKQVKRYMREAFTKDMFDDAGTSLADAADVLQLAHDIHKNDLESAKKHSNFDTIVREDIPMTVWNWMDKHVK